MADERIPDEKINEIIATAQAPMVNVDGVPMGMADCDWGRCGVSFSDLARELKACREAIKDSLSRIDTLAATKAAYDRSDPTNHDFMGAQALRACLHGSEEK